MNVWKIGREPWKFQHFCCHAWFGEWVTRFSLMVFFTLVVTFFAKYPTLKYAPWCKRDNYQALLPQFINLGTSSKYKASCWEQAKVATQQWNENVWKVEVENLESFVRKAVASLHTPKKASHFHSESMAGAEGADLTKIRLKEIVVTLQVKKIFYTSPLFVWFLTVATENWFSEGA